MSPAFLLVRKKAAIEAAKLPVSGLEFGEGELLLNGVPLAQLSAAEQLKLVCVRAFCIGRNRYGVDNRTSVELLPDFRQ